MRERVATSHCSNRGDSWAVRVFVLALLEGDADAEADDAFPFPGGAGNGSDLAALCAAGEVEQRDEELALAGTGWPLECLIHTSESSRAGGTKTVLRVK